MVDKFKPDPYLTRSDYENDVNDQRNQILTLENDYYRQIKDKSLCHGLMLYIWYTLTTNVRSQIPNALAPSPVLLTYTTAALQ